MTQHLPLAASMEGRSLQSHLAIAESCLILGVEFAWRSPEIVLVKGDGAKSLLDRLKSQGINVTRVEGFEFESTTIHPRIDRIFDASGKSMSALPTILEWGGEVWVDILLDDRNLPPIDPKLALRWAESDRPPWPLAGDKSLFQAHLAIIEACMALGVWVDWQGWGTILVEGKGAARVIRRLEEQRLRVLGMEGFDLESTVISARPDLVFDASEGTSVSRALSGWGEEIWVNVLTEGSTGT